MAKYGGRWCVVGIDEDGSKEEPWTVELVIEQVMETEQDPRLNIHVVRVDDTLLVIVAMMTRNKYTSIYVVFTILVLHVLKIHSMLAKVAFDLDILKFENPSLLRNY